MSGTLRNYLAAIFIATIAIGFPISAVGAPPHADIAIVGGTFVNDEALLREGLLTETFTLDTKLGKSPPIHYGVANGIPFYYIHAHGQRRWQTTWLALYELGVREVIGGATAGGINPVMQPYDYVIPHDFIDMNVDRPLSFPREVYRDPNKIPIPRFVPAMDPDLRQILLEETIQAIRGKSGYNDVNIHDNGVLIQARGGRFETVSEIKMFAQWGADVVTMNVATEMAYARMLGINYACLIVISNPAEGVAAWDFAEMPPLYQRINPLSLDIVLAALPRIAALKDKPRIGDTLINHPEMTAKPKAKNSQKQEPAPKPIQPQTTETILILGAVPQEIPPIVEQLENMKTGEAYGIPYWQGKLHDKPVVVAITGIGKTFTAMTTSLFITKFNPRLVLMTGTGARINQSLRTGDVIVATHLYEHDYGSLTKDGMVYREMNGPVDGAEVRNEFKPSPTLLTIAGQAMKQYPPRTVSANDKTYETTVKFGRVASSDLFGVTGQRIQSLRNDFKVDIMEMESAPLGLVCEFLKIPYLVVRSGSNVAQEAPNDDYLRLGPIAAKEAAMFTAYLVKFL